MVMVVEVVSLWLHLLVASSLPADVDPILHDSPTDAMFILDTKRHGVIGQLDPLVGTPTKGVPVVETCALAGELDRAAAKQEDVAFWIKGGILLWKTKFSTDFHIFSSGINNKSSNYLHFILGKKGRSCFMKV